MSFTAKLNLYRTELVSTAMSAVIKVKTDEGFFWKESTNPITLSRSGAGFYLKQKCQVGQLISLLLPMPRHIRCYDHQKELYRVWGLVQHCYPIFGKKKKVLNYHVGVAFVGKNVPLSYHHNPSQSYRISGIDQDGLWQVTETKTPFVQRKYPRFQISLKVVLQLLGANEKVIAHEKTMTDNISQGGAAVFSELDVSVGGCIRFNCKEYDFSALTVVRNQKSLLDSVQSLHLEFVNGGFPMKKINFPFKDTSRQAKGIRNKT